jgi:hypothetical protein
MGLRLDHDTEQNNLVRFVTAKSLGIMGPVAAEFAATDLAMALQDRDTDVQNASAEALEKMGPAAAPYAAKKLVQAMMEGTMEMRRLAIKALTAMGESCADVAAYPIARVMLALQPCCREYFHPVQPLRKEPPSVCSQCGASGPFAEGTDFVCAKGCDFNLCRRCWSRLFVRDVQMQRMAAEALPVLGVKAVKSVELELARALGDPDEGVRERARTALKKAKCKQAMGGSMALYNSDVAPCGHADCPFCNKELAMVTDAPSSIREHDDDEEVDEAGEPSTEAEEPTMYERQSSSGFGDISDDDDEMPASSEPPPEAASEAPPEVEADCVEDPGTPEKEQVEVTEEEDVGAGVPATERSAEEDEEQVARAEDYIKTPPNEEAKEGLFDEARSALLVAGFDGRLSSKQNFVEETDPEDAAPKRQRLRDPWGPSPRDEDSREKPPSDDAEGPGTPQSEASSGLEGLAALAIGGQ